MGNLDEVVAAWVAAWRPVGEAERRRLLEICWSVNGVYQDPTARISGRAALVQHIAGFNQRMPGAKIDLASGIDHHHGKFYYLWKMFGPDGQTMLEGFDYGELDPDGRISCIVGFFGSAPPLSAAANT